MLDTWNRQIIHELLGKDNIVKTIFMKTTFQIEDKY